MPRAPMDATVTWKFYTPVRHELRLHERVRRPSQIYETRSATAARQPYVWRDDIGDGSAGEGRSPACCSRCDNRPTSKIGAIAPPHFGCADWAQGG
jgi:hypothetical protein